jgi:hypothetical protein
MKLLKLLFLLLFVPLVFHAQKSLTGLWTGTLSNDSSTVRKDQSFEIALTQYKEKVYGYSRMNFIVNDTLYYIVKRVKGSIENEVCEVTDDEIISHNFPRKPHKGVKLITTFRRNREDSIWRLDGEWKTSESKKHGYYSISGKISLRSEPDISKSKIFPHLEELDLAKNIAFYKDSKKAAEENQLLNQKPIVTAKTLTALKDEPKQQGAEPVIAGKKSKESTDAVTNKIHPQPNNRGDKESPASLRDKEDASIKKNEPIVIAEEDAAFTGIKKSTTPATNIPGEQRKNVTGVVPKPEVNQRTAVKLNEPVIAAESQTGIKKTDAVVVKSNEEKKIITGEMAQPEFKISPAALFVAQRKTVAPQILEFKSDSLELKLYDNGEIDGDTVSILLNGEILLAKQGLKSSAIKKTIYIQPGTDEITLVLYAENLGKYPPNTGLLVVHDGEEVYQVRFSADLQQNAAVVFRRKK